MTHSDRQSQQPTTARSRTRRYLRPGLMALLLLIAGGAAALAAAIMTLPSLATALLARQLAARNLGTISVPIMALNHAGVIAGPIRIGQEHHQVSIEQVRISYDLAGLRQKRLHAVHLYAPELVIDTQLWQLRGLDSLQALIMSSTTADNAQSQAWQISQLHVTGATLRLQHATTQLHVPLTLTATAAADRWSITATALPPGGIWQISASYTVSTGAWQIHAHGPLAIDSHLAMLLPPPWIRAIPAGSGIVQADIKAAAAGMTAPPQLQAQFFLPELRLRLDPRQVAGVDLAVFSELTTDVVVHNCHLHIEHRSQAQNPQSLAQVRAASLVIDAADAADSTLNRLQLTGLQAIVELQRNAAGQLRPVGQGRAQLIARQRYSRSACRRVDAAAHLEATLASDGSLSAILQQLTISVEAANQALELTASSLTLQCPADFASFNIDSPSLLLRYNDQLQIETALAAAVVAGAADAKLQATADFAITRLDYGEYKLAPFAAHLNWNGDELEFNTADLAVTALPALQIKALQAKIAPFAQPAALLSSVQMSAQLQPMLSPWPQLRSGPPIDLALHWTGSRGELRIDHLHLVGIAMAPLVLPVQWQDNSVTLAAELTTPASQVRINFDADLHWLPQPQASVTWQAEVPDLTQMPALLHKANPQLAAYARLIGSGRVQFNGTAAWTAADSSATATVRLDNGALTIPGASELTLSNISTSIEFADFIELRSAPHQQLRIGAASIFGSSVTDAEIQFQLNGAEALFIENATASWSGGTVSFSALQLPPTAEARPLLLYIDDVDVGQILQLLPYIKGHGRGPLYGRIPLRLRNGQIQMLNAFIASKPAANGYLAIENTSALFAILGLAKPGDRQLNDAETILKDMLYNHIRVDFAVNPNDGSSAARLQLFGKSRNQSRLPPLDLDINIDAPWTELLDIGAGMQNLMHKINGSAR